MESGTEVGPQVGGRISSDSEITIGSSSLNLNDSRKFIINYVYSKGPQTLILGEKYLKTFFNHFLHIHVIMCT